MPTGDEFYKVTLDEDAGKLVAAGDSKKGAVDDALDKGHTLRVRLGYGLPGSKANWQRIKWPLASLKDPSYTLAISVPATVVDAVPPALVFSASGNPDKTFAEGGRLLVTLDKVSPKVAMAMSWAQVASVLAKLDLTFDAEMTCVNDGP